MACLDEFCVLEMREAVLPEVQLVHRLVVDVGTKTFGDVEPIASCLRCLTELFLLIGDVMLGTRNDSSILDASNGRTY